MWASSKRTAAIRRTTRRHHFDRGRRSFKALLCSSPELLIPHSAFTNKSPRLTNVTHNRSHDNITSTCRAAAGGEQLIGCKQVIGLELRQNRINPFLPFRQLQVSVNGSRESERAQPPWTSSGTCSQPEWVSDFFFPPPAFLSNWQLISEYWSWSEQGVALSFFFCRLDKSWFYLCFLVLVFLAFSS